MRNGVRTIPAKRSVIFVFGLIVNYCVIAQSARAGDGLDNWSIRLNIPTNRVNQVDFGIGGVAFGNGRFVATGPSGSVYVSTNGLDWLTVETGSESPLGEIVFGNGRFLTYRYNRYAFIASTNGVDWSATGSTNQSTAFAVYSNYADYPNWPRRPLAFANGQFLRAETYDMSFTEAGVWGGTRLFSSPDGGTWTVLMSVTNTLVTAFTVNGVTTGALGLYSPNPISVSGIQAAKDSLIVTDGAGLRFRKDIAPSSNSQLQYSYPCLVAGDQGFVGRSYRLFAYPEDNQLTLSDIQSQWAYPGSIINAFGQFVGIGYYVITSENGRTWRVRQKLDGSDFYRAIAFGNGRFVAASAGTLASSGPMMRLNISRSKERQISITGATGLRCTIEGLDADGIGASRGWQNLTNITMATESITWLDSSSPTNAGRLYRARAE